MRLTSKQLRKIIIQEARRLDESMVGVDPAADTCQQIITMLERLRAQAEIYADDYDVADFDEATATYGEEEVGRMKGASEMARWIVIKLGEIINDASEFVELT